MDKKRQIKPMFYYVDRFRISIQETLGILNQPANSFKTELSVSVAGKENYFGSPKSISSNYLDTTTILENLGRVTESFDDSIVITIEFSRKKSEIPSRVSFNTFYKGGNLVVEADKKEILEEHKFKGLDKALLGLAFRTSYLVIRKAKHEIDIFDKWRKGIDMLNRVEH
jgi:hypothetical protein